jgi:hypothetical protein
MNSVSFARRRGLELGGVMRSNQKRANTFGADVELFSKFRLEHAYRDS